MNPSRYLQSAFIIFFADFNVGAAMREQVQLGLSGYSEV